MRQGPLWLCLGCVLAAALFYVLHPAQEPCPPLALLPAPAPLRTVASVEAGLGYDFQDWPNAALFGLAHGKGPIPLEAILRKAAPGHGGYAVNIGARNGDPADADPVFALWANTSGAWRATGLAVEGVPEYCAELRSRLAGTGVAVACAFVVPHTVAAFLEEQGVPKEPALLKIDIDSTDCPVFEALLAGGFRPAVVHMEINYDLPPPLVFSLEYTPAVATGWFWRSLSFKGLYGCSLARIYEIGRAFNYSLVQAYGIDADLVRDDLLPSAAAAAVTDPVALYKRGALPQCSAFGGHFAWPTRCHGLQALVERDPEDALVEVFRHIQQHLPLATRREVLFRLYLAN